MNVLGVVVTYQPDLEQLAKSVATLRPQLDGLLLIDNASRETLLEPLRELARVHHCLLRENTENLGIATALNQGIAAARERGARFVLLSDQDSVVSPDFVAQEMACFRRESAQRRIGLVTPRIVNRVTQIRSGPVLGSDGEALMAQTSGALMPMEVFEDVGLFVDEMFINYVDYEHCLRMRLKGWHVVIAEDAILDHMPGVNTRIRRYGLTKIITDASPIRHYYEVRNLLWMARHYFRQFPGPMSRLLVGLARDSRKVLLFESKRRRKVGAWARGFFDALRNRLGARTF